MKNLIKALLILVVIYLLTTVFALAKSDSVMIYEVYTSGGYNSGKNTAPYKNCYVVLYNSLASDVDVSGWSLKFAVGYSNDVSAEVKLSGVIPANKFYVVKGGVCHDPANPAAGADLPFAVNADEPAFSLSRKSGKIALCSKDGENANKIASTDGFVVDFLGYGAKDTEVNDFETAPADGISVKKIFRRFTYADSDSNAADFDVVDIVDNPDKIINYDGNTYAKATSHVSFSKPAGYYKDEFTLSLQTNIGGSSPEIYYTIDGTNPISKDGSLSPSAIKYDDSAKIRIYDRTGQPTNMLYHTGTTTKIEDTRFVWPPPQRKDESEADYKKRIDDLFNGIFKINAIKAASKNAEGNISETAFNSYIVMDKTIAERFDMPVISITTNKDGLYNKETGIWMADNLYKTGKDWERRAELQFFEKDGKPAFSDTIGIRLNGGYTRGYPQKAIRVYLDNTLHYDLFDGDVLKANGKKLETFDNFLLRSSGNDWYASAIRDVFTQKLTEPLGSFDRVGYRPCITFINGELWGIYDIRERIDSKMFAKHNDISSDDVTVVESYLSYVDGDEKIAKEFKDFYYFVLDNDMTVPENYQRVCSEIDVDEYIDYMFSVIYSGYLDWPHNNIKMWKNSNPTNGADTKWHYIMQDIDYAFSSSSGPKHDTLLWAMTDELNRCGEFLKNLMANREFKEKFVKRADYLLREFFKPDYMQKVLDELRAEVSTATPEHRARWNLYEDDWGGSYYYISQYFNKRNPFVYESLKKNLGAVFFECDAAMGKIYADGIEINGKDKNFILANEKSRLSAQAKEGYEFAGFEFIPLEGEHSYSARNNATYIPSSGGMYKAVFVKKGDAKPSEFKDPVSGELKTKLKGSLSFVLDISEGYVNNEITPIDQDPAVKPVVINDRTLVPARFIAESLGGRVEWDGATNTGTCTVGSNVVKFVLDSNIMYVNGKEVKLDVPAQTVSGRTLLPLRAFCENLGFTVLWNETRSLIVISPKPVELSGSEMGSVVTALKGK